MGQQTMATSLGIHVTGDLGIHRVRPPSAITSRLPGPVTTPPGSWLRLGARIMPGLAGQILNYRGVKIVTGGDGSGQRRLPASTYEYFRPMPDGHLRPPYQALGVVPNIHLHSGAS